MNDRDLIQNAIDAVSGTGGVALLEPRMYLVPDGPRINLKSGVKLVGQGPATIIDSNIVGGATIQAENAFDVELHNFRLDGPGPDFMNTADHGIRLENVGNFRVSDVEIGYTRSMGIFARRVRNGRITGLSVNDTGRDGIHVQDGQLIVIDGNRTRRTGDDGIAFHSQNNKSSGCSITGNVIENAMARGLALMGPSDVTISGNTIDGTTKAGIGIGHAVAADIPAEGITISGNTIRGAGTFMDRIVPTPDRGGIRVAKQQKNQFAARNINIVGNTILGARTNFMMIGHDGSPSAAEVASVHISGNFMAGLERDPFGVDLRADYADILLRAAHSVSIIGNRLDEGRILAWDNTSYIVDRDNIDRSTKR